HGGAFAYQHGEGIAQVVLGFPLGKGGNGIISSLRPVFLEVEDRVHYIYEFSKLLSEEAQPLAPMRIRPLGKYLAHQPPEAARTGIRVGVAPRLDGGELLKAVSYKLALFRVFLRDVKVFLAQHPGL